MGDPVLSISGLYYLPQPDYPRDYPSCSPHYPQRSYLSSAEVKPNVERQLKC